MEMAKILRVLFIIHRSPTLWIRLATETNSLDRGLTTVTPNTVIQISMGNDIGWDLFAKNKKFPLDRVFPTSFFLDLVRSSAKKRLI